MFIFWLRDVQVNPIVPYMKTITLEMSEESAREILNVLQNEHDEHQSKASEHQSKANILKLQIDQIKSEFGFATLSVFKSQSKHPPSVTPLTKTPHGRNRKGASKHLIIEFLKQKNGTGATIKEITTDTGTVYGTARRILKKQLQPQGRVSVSKGLWKWVS